MGVLQNTAMVFADAAIAHALSAAILRDPQPCTWKAPPRL
jgi:hypothetical protein